MLIPITTRPALAVQRTTCTVSLHEALEASNSLRSVLGSGGKKRCCVANPDVKQPSRVFGTLDVLAATVEDLQVLRLISMIRCAY
jgi:hypothetical protein